MNDFPWQISLHVTSVNQ